MNVFEQIDPSWVPLFKSILYKEPLKTLKESILPNTSYQPHRQDIFRVFEMPINRIKVVLLGQDPYPTPGDAIGLSFATSSERKIPTSLRIIIKELENSIEGFNASEYTKPNNNYKTLDHWRKQGVFLLNAALTVETGKAGSHIKYWEEFTKQVIQYISIKNPCVWLLWGIKAQKFISNISCTFNVKGYNKTTIQDIPLKDNCNYVIKTPHPAAEVYTGGKASFYGSNCFYNTNIILNKKFNKQINF